MASKDEAEWDQAHEVDTDTGRPTKELYTDNDPVTTIKGSLISESFFTFKIMLKITSYIS
jgi:hypothetical protein